MEIYALNLCRLILGG